MKFGYLLLVFLSFGDGFESLDNQVCQSECPTWFVPVDNNGTINCICGDALGGRVLCDQNSNTSAVHFHYCVTYDEVSNSTLITDNPYHYHKPDIQGQYVKLPQNVCDLNEFMCGGLNRTGLLCSDCEAGLGPAVFSYTLPCLKCLDSGYGWLLYMFLATFPTTVMFLVIIFCQVRITAASMNALIFTCQVLANMMNADPHMFTDAPQPSYYVTLFLLTIYGVFNLDFFRYILPQFCISNTMTTIQALCLEYIVAFYPLLLIIAFYTAIQLHARGCKLLVYLWRPFQRCCGCISRRWNPLGSLVHTFAAFLLLSYSKILSVSLNLLLHGASIVDSSGRKIGHLTMYYNASLPYFSTEHLPFALLAIGILSTFTVLPVLILLLYPTRVFQRCIGCCSTGRRWHALHAFVDAFQGYYKDGTNGTRDWRYFSGFYLIFRIVAIATHVLPDLKYRVVCRIACYSFASLLFGLLRPYKENWINYWDSIGLTLFAFGEFVVIYDEYVTKAHFSLAVVLAVVPFAYLIVYTTYKLLSRARLLYYCGLCCRNSGESHASSVGDLEREVYTDHDSEEGKPLLTKASDPGRSYSEDQVNTEHTFPVL